MEKHNQPTRESIERRKESILREFEEDDAEPPKDKKPLTKRESVEALFKKSKKLASKTATSTFTAIVSSSFATCAKEFVKQQLNPFEHGATE